MAALVQTITQPIATVSMLQTRPASSSSATTFSHQRAGSARSGNIVQYRAGGNVAQPLNQIPGNNQSPSRPNTTTNPRFEHRSMSAPGDAPLLSSSSSKADESSESILKAESNRLSLASTPLDLSLIDPRSKNDSLLSGSDKPVHKKSSSDSTSSGTLSASASTIADTLNIPSLSTPSLSKTGLSKDDTAISQLSGIAQKYRRRSIATKDDPDSQSLFQPSVSSAPTRTWASIVSTPYNPSKPESRPSPTNNTSSGTNSTTPSSSEAEVSGLKNPTSSQEPTVGRSVLRVINVPPRGSSDATKRLVNPSPLSKPLSADMDEPAMQSSSTNPTSDQSLEIRPRSPPSSNTESPAQQHLASLSKKDGKRDGKSSRLRRAFSFGSAAELRKASAENNHANTTRKLQKPQYDNEEEAREAAIVKQQEAAGLGNSIYSGQGNVFAGSTDNVSVSSTASSASIMLRKMGKGMKKGTRSLVGLFRPKSIIGAPAPDSAVPEISTAQVSMVTAEAERDVGPLRPQTSDQVGVESNFPRIDLGSLDTFNTDSYLKLDDRDTADIKPRRSIVGTEKDRADVLAAVKKGILKRAGTDSGSASPSMRSPDQVLAELPQPGRSDGLLRSGTSDGPGASAARGHRRTDSVTIEGEDYFIPMGRFQASDSKSLPGTPRGVARNISFSPRIQFHDTWTANDYDRRSETATCNRLTPSLAQAIKEELNSFKMEMEVHESSKMYTHFF